MSEICRNLYGYLPVLLWPAGNILIGAGQWAWPALGAAFWLPVLGAALEELFFRELLLRRWLLRREGMRPVRAVLLAAALFGVAHLCNTGADAVQAPGLMGAGGGLGLLADGMDAVWLQAFGACCFGVWAGAAVVRTDSLCLPLVAHVLVNVTAGFLPQTGEPAAGTVLPGTQAVARLACMAQAVALLYIVLAVVTLAIGLCMLRERA